MRRSDFHFELPEALIAQEPLEHRSASRLLVMRRNDGTLEDSHFSRLLDHLEPDDLLVFNDTRVIKARLFGRKETGGRVELLIERITGADTGLAQIRASKSPRAGTRIFVGDQLLEVGERSGELFRIRANGDLAELLEREGHVPLPPYIRRADRAEDLERYQTVYARTPGAVAAPTAGLHFDAPLLEQLTQAGIRCGHLTLHVGAGTFQPMRVEQVDAHRMHRERYVVSAALARQHAETRMRGGRVIAVGTTSVRALVSCSDAAGTVAAGEGETELFLYPGREVPAVDGLITNFHLPESTLLMLVCAFAGTNQTLAAYRHAVAQRYRFFSYGDAMLIL